MLVSESKRKPCKPTSPNGPWAFRVWAHCPTFHEDTKPWKLVALFRFLQEALDYIEYANKAGANVIHQSPTGCKEWTPKSWAWYKEEAA